MDALEGSRDDRLRWMLALCDFGIEVQRQNIRRAFPSADEDEVSLRLQAWLVERPGADLGDGAGRPTSRGLVRA